MKQILYVFVFLCFKGIVAQNTTLFNEGNELYRTEKYTDATTKYLELLNSGYESSELYFNLGNSYYKQHNTGLAIYYFEKALQLNPGNEDVKANLNYAQKSVVDSIDELPKTFTEKLQEEFFNKFTYNTWAVIVVILSFIVAFVWIAFYYAFGSGLKRTYFSVGIVATVMFLVSIIVTGVQYNQAKNIKQAIVTVNRVKVVNEPSLNASEAFVLHEGTKVKVLDGVYDWKKVKIANGAVGWLQLNTIKEL